MAYREFQTAACHVVHLVRPTEADAKRLATSFHLHPLDLDGLFTVSPRPRVGAYRHYLAAFLPWPVTDSRRGQVMMSEIQLFIGQHFLIICSDGGVTDIRDVVTTWSTSPTPLTDTPAMMAYELLLTIAKSTDQAAQRSPSPMWAKTWRPLTETIQSMQKKMSELGWLSNEDNRAVWKFLSYTMKHIGQRLTALPERAQVLPQRTPALQGAVASYAVASAILTAVVLLVISFSR